MSFLRVYQFPKNISMILDSVQNIPIMYLSTPQVERNLKKNSETTTMPIEN